MTPRKKEKIVKLQGREFKISAFDAFTGSYIAFTFMEKIMPMGMQAKVAAALKAEGREVVLPEDRPVMSKAEFTSFQKDCLSVVSEVLQGRDAPVFNPNGSWGIADASHNTALVLMLSIHALVFNIGDFLSADVLQELKEALAGMIPQSTPTSTPGSTPR